MSINELFMQMMRGNLDISNMTISPEYDIKISMSNISTSIWYYFIMEWHAISLERVVLCLMLNLPSQLINRLNENAFYLLIICFSFLLLALFIIFYSYLFSIKYVLRFKNFLFFISFFIIASMLLALDFVSICQHS